jgi:hypothetical protein
VLHQQKCQRSLRDGTDQPAVLAASWSASASRSGAVNKCADIQVEETRRCNSISAVVARVAALAPVASILRTSALSRSGLPLPDLRSAGRTTMTRKAA